MPKLSTEEVKHIANLSKLHLTESEILKFQNQLSSVLDYVNQLNEVDTTNIDPLNNATNLQNVFREDEIEASGITYEEIALNAPKFKDGSFVVPGVFE